MFWDVLERAVLCLVIAANAKDAGQYFANFPFYFSNLTLGRARKFIPQRGTKGRGVDGPPPPVLSQFVIIIALCNTCRNL